MGIASILYRPKCGIATDAAHSVKEGKTEYQGVDILTGERLFYRDLGDKTVNIGEFLAVVDAVKYVIENDFQPRVIYTDSMTALAWVKRMEAGSQVDFKELELAGMFLKAMLYDVRAIEILHWDNKAWGETPADFGRK